jgi:hypothetical protein
MQRILPKNKGRPIGGLFTQGEYGRDVACYVSTSLKGRFDLKSPGFEQGFRDEFRVLIATRPFAQPGGTDVLVRCELVLLHCLFEGCNNWNYRANRLRLAPVRVATTLCHRLFALPHLNKSYKAFVLMFLRWVWTLVA